MSVQDQPRSLSTPWGGLTPAVDLAPLLFTLAMYGVVFFIPGNLFVQFVYPDDDTIGQWLQFACYLLSAFFCLRVVIGGRGRLPRWQWIGWILLMLGAFLFACEEISWGERITGFGVDSLRQINSQGETTLHNIPAVQSYMAFFFIVSGLFAGYFGWRYWPGISLFPARRFSLYFLPVALFYAYYDLSWITLQHRIVNHQELYELLFSVGLMLHCRAVAGQLQVAGFNSRRAAPAEPPPAPARR